MNTPGIVNADKKISFTYYDNTELFQFDSGGRRVSLGRVDHVQIGKDHHNGHDLSICISGNRGGILGYREGVPLQGLWQLASYRAPSPLMPSLLGMGHLWGWATVAGHYFDRYDFPSPPPFPYSMLWRLERIKAPHPARWLDCLCCGRDATRGLSCGVQVVIYPDRGYFVGSVAQVHGSFTHVPICGLCWAWYGKILSQFMRMI